MRDPNRIDHILGAVKRLWQQSPDLRLCQLISNAVGRATEEEVTDCFHIEDDVLLRGLELSIEDVLRSALRKRRRRFVETKFQTGQEVEVLPHPGWTGTIVMIDVFAKRYLLDCHPDAIGHYVGYKVPKGMLDYESGGILAGNWFHEDELREVQPD